MFVKSEFILIEAHNNFLEELLFILVSSILMDASPFEVSKGSDLSGLAFR